MSHTPGPWIIRTFHGREWVVDSTPDLDGQFVGQVIHQPCTNPDDKANARLIAAAPELLEACKSTLVDLRVARLLSEKGFGETIARLEAAIAKAEGQ